MRPAHVIIAFASLLFTTPAWAMCQDGAKGSCIVNGKHGTRECIRGYWGPCEVDEDEGSTGPSTGVLYPKYLILFVLYAPPGTQGGLSTSSVTYASGSTAGTTVSAQNGFKQGYAVSVEASNGIIGDILGGGSVSTNFGYARNASNAQALDIKKSASTQISVTGPSSDGIDHDHDVIWLWLNPSLRASTTPSALKWTVDTGIAADIQYVYVGHLKNPALMPLGVAQRLQQYNIGVQDYAEMLKADPFAQGSATVDPARHKQLFTTFPYEPPYGPGDPVIPFTFNAQGQMSSSQSSSVSNEYTVGLSITAKQSFIDLVKLEEKVSGQWTWTSVDTTGSSSGSSESATVTVGGPSYGYTGPTDMAVYEDVLYKTFLFVPVTTTLRSLHGTLRLPTKRSLAGTEVTLIANGLKYRTFTDAKGNYRFPGAISGKGKLTVRGHQYAVPRLGPDAVLDLKLSR